MSTRAVIARPCESEAGHWEGRYHHSDGYPSGLGKELWKLLHQGGAFDGKPFELLRTLIDDHTGWSNIIDADWSKTPGFVNNRSRPDDVPFDVWWKSFPPQCYCHGDRNEEGWFITSEGDDSGTEWAYVIDPTRETLTVYENVDYETQGAETWRERGAFSLDGLEPDWKELES